MCIGLSTNNWNGLWVSALWVEVPATGAVQWLLDRLKLSVCSLCVPPGLLSLLSAWARGHRAAAALPLSHTPPDLLTLNDKEVHAIPVGWIKSNSFHLLLHLLSSVGCSPVLLLKETLNL